MGQGVAFVPSSCSFRFLVLGLCEILVKEEEWFLVSWWPVLSKLMAPNLRIIPTKGLYLAN